MTHVHPWNEQLWNQLSERRGGNHALLFYGQAGIGKLDFAYLLARHWLCKGDPRMSTLFDAGSYPDFHLIAAESETESMDDNLATYAGRYLTAHSGKPRQQIAVDQIRSLIQSLNTHTHFDSSRLVLIPHAERMNINAANALLKSLEEPPAKTNFILICEELGRLPATIRSRCSVIPFATPSIDQGLEWLHKEHQLSADDASFYLALSNGQPLTAINLFQRGFKDTLRAVFEDLKNLWAGRLTSVSAAENWKKIGSDTSIDILQKLVIDLWRLHVGEPHTSFYPVQEKWLAKALNALDAKRIPDCYDQLSAAKRLRSGPADELLILENISLRLGALSKEH